MTNEKKMKDLMARMVAMSPEPPEFPQEIEMTQPASAPRRSPALILAIATAAVVALALPLLLFQGTAGEEPVGTTAPAPVTTLPEATPTTTPGPDTTPPTTVPIVTEFDGVIYLIQEPDNSFLGNPAMVPVSVSLTDASGVLRGIEDPALVVTRLADLGVTLPEGLTTVIPPGVDGVNGGVDDSSPAVITMYMNEAFLEGAGGLLADVTMLNQIIYTVTQEDPEALVQFIVNDQPVEAYGTEGLSLLEPVGRDTFLDDLNPIILTEPFLLGGDGLPHLEGRANVFEAGLTVQVVDPSSGEALYEEPVMASCGTGCWGIFTHEFDTPVLSPETVVKVFWYSAEDGEPADVVTVPVAEGAWNLTP
ncbi:MAG: Gmad2 immunoglobulin-like domain-containing protein [Acidimicrobiia bacterium]